MAGPALPPSEARAISCGDAEQFSQLHEHNGLDRGRKGEMFFGCKCSLQNLKARFRPAGMFFEQLSDYVTVRMLDYSVKFTKNFSSFRLNPKP